MKESEDVTKEQLIKDLTELRSRINEFERSEEDIRKHQEELNRARAMFEGLFEFAPDAIIVVGRGGEIVRVNKQAEKLFGYSRDELLNLHHEILLPERFRRIHEEHRGRYMSDPHIRPMGTGLELCGIKKGGSEFSADIALGSLKVGDNIVVIAVIRDVSSLKRTEEELREVEDTLNLTKFSVDHSSVSAFLIGKDARILYVNEQARRSLHYSREELMGMTIPDLDPYFPISVWNNTWDRLKKEGSLQFETVHRRKDGTLIPVEISANYVSFLGREYDWAYSVDISERKRAETALQESEKRYRTLFSAIDEGFCIIEVIFDENEKPIDYRFLVTNQAFEKHTGLIGAQGKTVRELVPKHEEHWFQIYGKIALTGQPARFQNRAEQLHRWYDVYAFRVGKPEDRQVAVLFNDITERKETEETLKLTQFSVERASVSAFLIGKDARIQYVNEQAYRSLQYSREELLGMTIPDLDPNVPMSAWNDMWARLKEKGSFSFESLHRKKDGTLIPVEITANYVSFGGKEYDWAYSVDISERKRAEEAMRRAADTGEQLQRVMVAISNSRNFEEALRQLLDAALRLTGMEGGGVYLVEKEQAVLRYHKGMPEAFVSDVKQIPMERPMIKAVLKQKNLIDLVEDFGDIGELCIPYGIHHAFSIPLRVRDEPFGFLNVGSTRKEAPAQVDIQTLSILATATESLLHRLLIENALRESEAKLSAILHNTPAAVYVIGADGRFIHINRRVEELFGITNERAAGTALLELFPRETAASLLNNNAKVIESRTPLEFEETIQLADGLHTYSSVKSPLLDASGRAHAIVGISTDISERKKMEEEIRHLAHHDALTGLPNRRLFRDIFDVEVAQARRNYKKLAILFLDLDRFKEINDTLGHEIGDELLKEAAGLFRKTVRASDTVARIGGDEFNIILSDIARPEDVSEIAQKIIRHFRSPFSIFGNELNVTTSIGISVYPDDGREIDTLLRYADIAMYHAKESGRNTFRFYNPAINVRSIERMRLENMLRRSIVRKELIIYYQPQIDIQNKRMMSAEALVRWQHPEQGFLTPDRFLAQAEETGFITEIDEWAMKTVCAQVRSWIESGLPPVCVTVNISARQFEKPDLVDRIASILKETRLEPGFLNLEVTETTAMSDVDRSVSQLRELRKMGVHVTIDDFGTGYSSLNYLKKLPIERLKIDKSFIQDIARDADDRAIISAVTSMARKMGIRTVAEGVETEEQLEFLRASECDEAQGFLFSRPLPAEEFRELIRKAA